MKSMIELDMLKQMQAQSKEKRSTSNNANATSR